MKVKLLITSIAIAVSSAALAQSPAVLTPGSSVLNPVLTGFPMNIVGGYIAATFNESFTGLNTFGQTAFTGYLNSYVFQQANGDLAFAWIIANDPMSTDAINHFSVTGYTGFQTSVAQDPYTGFFPNTSSLVASRSGNGDVVSFNFLPGAGAGLDEIAPGSFSSAQWIFTDAKSYTYGSAQISDGGVATVETFAPNAVPEPASMVALGMGALGLLRRKRS